jgi:hypothetical protein
MNDNGPNSPPPPVSGPGGGGGLVPGSAGGGGPDPGKVVLAVNSVIAAVGGTFASTHNITATVVAGGAGLACAVVIVWKR